ncbi:MAG: methionyl-tRNA formyltransferase [Pseudomonadota bacterium]
MRIVFMGTPDFAVPTLLDLVGQGHQILACYTQPPRPAGRGMAERKSPVHLQAEAFGVPVFTPTSVKSVDEQQAFAALSADVAVVVAYGLILPPAILSAPVHGCLNLHASLLPRWRGAAPIQRAIMAGDAETGVMVMRMAEGLDTGPICMAERVAIGPDDTARDLHDRLARLGADLMVRALGALSRDTLTCAPQPEDGVTYAAKIDKAEAKIDWSQPARAVHDHIRGLSPFPGAWTKLERGRGDRVKLLRSEMIDVDSVGADPGTALDDGLTIACGKGAIRLLELQRAGKSALSADEFLRGTPIAEGDGLG